MESVEFWQLADDDRELVDQITAGLGRNAGRVLAYLLLCHEHAAVEDPRATQLMLRVGTGVNRKAVSDALSRLDRDGLVTQTTIREHTRGRPPKAWHVTADRDSLLERVYAVHARDLREQAAAVAGIEQNQVPNQESPSNPVPADDSETDDRETATVTVALNWHPNALHVPLYAADCRGEFDRRDLEISFDHHRGSHRALDAVVDGDADVGLVGGGTLVRARPADAPVVPVGVLYQRATTVLYTTREQFGEALERVDQLRGCRIATARGSETCLLARLFLSQTDVLDDLTVVDTAGEEETALRDGDADVATGAFSDPIQLADAGVTVDTLHVGEGFPIYGPTLVVREETLRKAPSLVDRVLAGTTAGWAEAQRRPESAGQAIAEASDKSPATVRRLFDHAVEEFGTSDAMRTHGWGWQRADTWERLDTVLSHSDLLEGSP